MTPLRRRRVSVYEDFKPQITQITQISTDKRITRWEGWNSDLDPFLLF